VSEEIDMERPVTRRELKLEVDRIDGKIDRLDTKLDAVCGALLSRMDAMMRETAEMRAETAEMRAEMAEMRADAARQAKAAMEWALEQFRAVDDKYADLPRRVTRLEGKVFPPKRARRR
jgi:hypothetical protein